MSSTVNYRFDDRTLVELLLQDLGISRREYEQEIIHRLDLENARRTQSRHRTSRNRTSKRWIYHTRFGTVYTTQYHRIVKIVRPRLTHSNTLSKNTVAPSIEYRRRRRVAQS
jgi:hypothetical protein